MEKTLDKQKLEAELQKMDEWAKAVIFNEKGDIIAHKACNARKE